MAESKTQGKTSVAEAPPSPAMKPAGNASMAPANAPGQAERTVIARGTEFQGSMTSTCGVTLDGKLRGELKAPSLVLNAGGAIDGNVEVEELTSCGSLAGHIKAKNVQLSGKVSDRTVIRAETLEVKLAQPGTGMQVSFGDCKLEVGNSSAQASMQTPTSKPGAPAAPQKPQAKPGNDRGL